MQSISLFSYFQRNVKTIQLRQTYVKPFINNRFFFSKTLMTLSCIGNSGPPTLLTLSWWGSLSNRNQSINLLYKSNDWPLRNRDLHHERTKAERWSRSMETNTWFAYVIEHSVQKQSSRGVFRKRCSENIQQVYRRTTLMPKCDFNKFARQLIETI